MDATVFNHYIAALHLHVHVTDLSEHISGMFVPEVTSGKIQCHLDTGNVLCVRVCVDSRYILALWNSSSHMDLLYRVVVLQGKQ